MAKDGREFQAQLLDWRQIHALPEGWPSALLLDLLAILEVDGVAEGEALEMALMGLQDLRVRDLEGHVHALDGVGGAIDVRKSAAPDAALDLVFASL